MMIFQEFFLNVISAHTCINDNYSWITCIHFFNFRFSPYLVYLSLLHLNSLHTRRHIKLGHCLSIDASLGLHGVSRPRSSSLHCSDLHPPSVIMLFLVGPSSFSSQASPEYVFSWVRFLQHSTRVPQHSQLLNPFLERDRSSSIAFVSPLNGCFLPSLELSCSGYVAAIWSWEFYFVNIV